MYTCKVINNITRTVTTGGGTTTVTSSALSFDVYQRIADEVITGNWGGGDERRTRLEAAGYNYDAVMTIVNHELLGTAIDTSLFESTTTTTTTSGTTTVTEVKDEHTFHYPPGNSKNALILSGSITNEMNRAGTFDFQLPPTNSCLQAGYFKKLSSIIEVYWSYDEKPIFRGRIIDSTKAFAGTVNFKCEGMMAFLNDSIVRPINTESESEEGEDTVSISVPEFFTQLITDHNNQVGSTSPKYFNIHVDGYSSEDVSFPKPNYETTLDYIQSNFLGNENVGGRMWVDYEYDPSTQSYSSHIYLYADIERLQVTCGQTIAIGKNLSDFTETINAADIYTVIIPTGKDGLTLGSTDYIENAEAISKYGRIWHHEDFSDIEDVNELRTKATELLQRNSGEVTSIEVSALDLHIMDFEQPMIEVGSYVPVLSPPHGIDVAYICSAANIDLCNPTNTKYTLGVNPETLTTKQLKLSRAFAETNLYYKSEAATYNISYSVYGGRVEIYQNQMRFYSAGSTVYLSCVLKFLAVVTNEDPTILTFDTYYNPISEATGTATDQTLSRDYTITASNGQIQIANNSEIQVNDIVSCTMTWTTR